jgi:hypothetical protein
MLDLATYLSLNKLLGGRLLQSKSLQAQGVVSMTVENMARPRAGKELTHGNR